MEKGGRPVAYEMSIILQIQTLLTKQFIGKRGDDASQLAQPHNCQVTVQM